VGPRAGLEALEKRKSRPYRDSNSDPSVVQPVASRYTDYSIPDLMYGGPVGIFCSCNDGFQLQSLSAITPN
jgi:hypothetical protein